MKRFLIKLIALLPLADTVILIQNGRAEVKRGKASVRLLSELSELSKSNGVEMACINANAISTGFRLTFFGIPGEIQQRFRNTWGVNWR